MGCDIHPFLEAKIGGQWRYIGALKGERNYALFGLLSGVRSDIYDQEFDAFHEFHEGQGLSPEVLRECERWGSDAHSKTIVYPDGLRNALKKNKLDKTEDECNKLYAKAKTDEQREAAWEHYGGFLLDWVDVFDSFLETEFIEDVRAVMWYDN